MSDRVTSPILTPALTPAHTQPLNGAAQPREAIARAARSTGVDFDYLLAQAQIESGLNPRAEARTSSASGLFQFIDQTWLATLDRHGERLGLGTFSDAIETSGGRARITDPAMRETIMDLRFDPAASSLMAGALATDNSAALQGVLGREADPSELYLAHFLGSSGATNFLTALQQNPDQSAVALLPRAAASNRAIFRHPSGAPRSVGEVMGVVRQRVETAMALGAGQPSGAISTPTFPSAFPSVPGFPQVASTPAPAAPMAPPASPPSVQPPSRLPAFRPPLPYTPAGPVSQGGPLPSMTQTLRASFSLDGAAGNDLPGMAHVRNAYARLGAFGL